MKIDRGYEWSLSLERSQARSFIINRKRIFLNFKRKVFLPHPDSLLLANSIKIKATDEVLDMGLGTGILAITAAKLGALKVYGTDTNETAVELSNKNAVLNGVSEKCFFKKGNWFKPFSTKCFDVIITNPPQIPGNSRTESKYFRSATYGGYDGTIPTQHILEEAPKHLNKNGRVYIVLKEWMDWKKVIRQMKKQYNYKKIGETFSPVWTDAEARLSKISQLIRTGKARFYPFQGKQYYRIYCYELQPK